MTLRIGSAPRLETLGYLELGNHILIINNVEIKVCHLSSSLLFSVVFFYVLILLYFLFPMEGWRKSQPTNYATHS